jgi:peptidyl-prolyl cis-trans isomerase B (cyclophilin B)
VDKNEARRGQHRITDSAATETNADEARRGVGSSSGAIAGAVAAVLVMVIGIWGLTALGRSSNKPATPVAAAAATQAQPTQPEQPQQPTAAPTTAPAAPGDCVWTPANESSGASIIKTGTPPTSGNPHSGKAIMQIKSNLGEIDITMDLAKTPCTAASFTYLGTQKYFDNSQCHRLVTSGIFVLQCGDPSGTGAGGPSYVFADENLGQAGADGSVVYPRGSVAMANAGPGTNGSQFFINFADTQLAPSYTPFGTVTKGLDIVDKIAKGGDDGAYASSAGGGHPKVKFVISSIRVVQA